MMKMRAKRRAWWTTTVVGTAVAVIPLRGTANEDLPERFREVMVAGTVENLASVIQLTDSPAHAGAK